MAPRNQLLRFVVDAGGDLRLDPTATLPGRGAYLCRRAECWDAAARRGAFDRALRGNASLPAHRPF